MTARQSSHSEASRSDRHYGSPACTVVGHISNPCAYCGQPSTEARDRLAAMIADLAPATADRREHLHRRIGWQQ